MTTQVLLTHDGRCKVTDFGLSRCEELKTFTTTATMRDSAAGTPAFMAPAYAADACRRANHGELTRLLELLRPVPLATGSAAAKPPPCVAGDGQGGHRGAPPPLDACQCDLCDIGDCNLNQ